MKHARKAAGPAAPKAMKAMKSAAAGPAAEPEGKKASAVDYFDVGERVCKTKFISQVF